MKTFQEFINEADEYHGYVDTSPERWENHSAVDHKKLATDHKAASVITASVSSSQSDRHEAYAKFHAKMAEKKTTKDKDPSHMKRVAKYFS